MEQEVPELEQRLSELQAQVDRLSLSLQAWRQNDHVEPAERRLTQLTERCTEILEAWKTLGERHAGAVDELESRLDAWGETESRLERDAAQRYQHLGRMIEREWLALRQLHEEPVKLLREQAASLTEVCIATANSAQTGFDRAEARFATLETELHRRMADLSRDVHMAVAALKAPTEGQQWALPAGTSPAWPLEGVMRLHSQLREGDVSGREMGPTDTALTEGPKPKALPEPAHVADNALVERIDSLERAVNDRKAELREYADAAEQTRQANQRWRLAVAALVVCLFGSVVVAWGLQRRADSAVARSADAERQSRTAADQANERIAKAQKEAALEISQARDAAVKAQTISTVLAAPDLVRYNLTGGDNAQRFSGQVLWSRSRGLVFSASRLPPAAPGTTYQVWLLTNAEPVSAGLVAPDESGRATIATDDPPRVPRPVTSIKVTVEPTAGSEQPTGPTVLTRAPVGEP